MITPPNPRQGEKQSAGEPIKRDSSMINSTWPISLRMLDYLFCDKFKRNNKNR